MPKINYESSNQKTVSGDVMVVKTKSGIFKYFLVVEVPEYDYKYVLFNLEKGEKAVAYSSNEDFVIGGVVADVGLSTVEIVKIIKKDEYEISF